MAAPLIATKNYPPIPQAQWIRRERLTLRLKDALINHHRLVLISAAAGAGKSSLLADWAASELTTVIWVSLDTQDNDLSRFWTYCLAGLQFRYPPSFTKLLEESRTITSITLITYLNELVNALSQISSDKLILVLDDYHLIDSIAIHNSVSYLIDHLPPNSLLVIATRSDPPLPLYRWRAHGQLTEIRFDDLRFTLEETTQYLTGSMKLALNQANIALLGQRTEGWIVGLHLAALLMQRHTDPSYFIDQFSSNNHYILEYLTNEVLSQLAPEEQEFLLQISILPQFNPLLCAAVTGRVESAALLDHFWRANLFLIPLDDNHFWFRYHHLFADLLHQKLKQLGQKNLEILNQKAADWYAANNLVDDAIRAALAAGNHLMAAGLVLQNRKQSLYAGNFKRFFDAMEQVPESLLDSDARLRLAYAVLLYNNGQTAPARIHLAKAEEAYSAMVKNSSFPSDDLDFQTLPGQMASFRAMLSLRSVNLIDAICAAEETYRVALPNDHYSRVMAGIALGRAQSEMGNWGDALQTYRRSLPLSERAGNIIGSVVNLHQTAVILRIQGQLQEASLLINSALSMADSEQFFGLPAVGTLLVSRAEIEYEQNQLSQVQSTLLECSTQVRLSGYLDIQKSFAVLSARVLATQGDLEQAVLRLHETLDIMQNAEMNLAALELRAYQAYYQACLGSLDTALWIQSFSLPLTQNPGLTLGVTLFLLARVYLLSGNLFEAELLLQQLEVYAREDRSLRRLAEALLLGAILSFQQGNQNKASEQLEESLQNGALRGYMRLYLDEGAPLQELLLWYLKYQKKTGKMQDTVQKIINSMRTFPQEQVSNEASANLLANERGKPELIEPLSLREIEVLGLMSEGLTNPQIAQQLIISLSTVKTHLNNIYGKLNVRNRAEAVLHAKDLRIL